MNGGQPELTILTLAIRKQASYHRKDHFERVRRYFDNDGRHQGDEDGQDASTNVHYSKHVRRLNKVSCNSLRFVKGIAGIFFVDLRKWILLILHMVCFYSQINYSEFICLRSKPTQYFVFVRILFQERINFVRRCLYTRTV